MGPQNLGVGGSGCVLVVLFVVPCLAVQQACTRTVTSRLTCAGTQPGQGNCGLLYGTFNWGSYQILEGPGHQERNHPSCRTGTESSNSAGRGTVILHSIAQALAQWAQGLCQSEALALGVSRTQTCLQVEVHSATVHGL